MVRFSVKTHTNKGIKKFYDLISTALHKQWFLFQNDLVDLAYKTRDVMRQKIEETRKREKGNGKGLVDYIDVDLIDTVGKIHLGIGNITILNEKVPYWKVVNYGGMIPNYGKKVPIGAFSTTGKPQNGFGNERWIVGKDYALSRFGKYFSFKPKKPIEPKHYIEVGKYYFKRNINNIVKKYFRMTKKGL